MNRRELLKGLLGIGLTGGLLGCGRDSSGRITLTYNTHWTGRDAHTAVMDWMYEEFRKRHPEIDFQVVQVAGGTQDTGQKLMAELAAGAGPDVLHDTTYDQVRARYCLDLTELIKPWGDRFYPDALDACTWDGHVFSLPTEYSMVPCIWNTRLLDKVDKEIPTTYDEYLEVGRALKKKGICLTSFRVAGTHLFFSILFGFPDAVERIAAEEWESEPFKRCVEVLKELWDAGFIPVNDIELAFSTGASLFQTEQLAHYMNGAWTLINEITADGVDRTLRDHVAFTPFPEFEGRRPIRAWVATRTGLNHKLKYDKPKRDAALAFMELFTSKEAARRFVRDARSPEGVKFEWDEELSGQLLYNFFNSRKQASSVFVLPTNPGFFGEQTQVRALPDVFACITEGGSVKKALALFAEVLRA